MSQFKNKPNFTDTTTTEQRQLRLKGAEIGRFEPQGTVAFPLKSFVGEPILEAYASSSQWQKSISTRPTLSLVARRTPLGPFLTIEYRRADCWLFILADFGDAELWPLLDSWTRKKHGIMGVITGNTVHCTLNPVGDLSNFGIYRAELSRSKPVAFMNNVAYMVEHGVLERYALAETRPGEPRPIVELNLLSTDSVAETANRMEQFATVPKSSAFAALH
ncbi:hypothetical protein PQR70_36715 [Paraburkholderia madseniana]|uniref:hypothetical protein n=1 Tax=Paraburkholderia madseniana TaxID=2599607 RepID=UPI0038BC89F8